MSSTSDIPLAELDTNVDTDTNINTDTDRYENINTGCKEVFVVFHWRRSGSWLYGLTSTDANTEID